MYVFVGAHSGISPHSDFNNFILTCHLGVQIPTGNDKVPYVYKRLLYVCMYVYYGRRSWYTTSDLDCCMYVCMIMISMCLFAVDVFDQ